MHIVGIAAKLKLGFVRHCRAFVAINFACAAYALLTAVYAKKLASKHWLHHMDQVRIRVYIYVYGYDVILLFVHGCHLI
jgi:hypothetical protein